MDNRWYHVNLSDWRSLIMFNAVGIDVSKGKSTVYQFLDRKRSEGKPYLVYMTAGANKFLRIYYGKVKACITAQSKSE